MRDYLRYHDHLLKTSPITIIAIVIGVFFVLLWLSKYSWMLRYRKNQILLHICAIIFFYSAWLSWHNQHPIYELAFAYHKMASRTAWIPETTTFFSLAYGLLGILSLFISKPLESDKAVVVLDGVKFVLRAFNRGWLITGKTGAGKTEGPVIQIIWQLTRNIPAWGGLIIDWKCDLTSKVLNIFNTLNLPDKGVVIRVKAEKRLSQGISQDFDIQRFNLLSYPLPHMTYAKLLLDTASSLGQKDNQSFFSTQAQIHIANAIEALHLLKRMNDTNSIEYDRTMIKLITTGDLTTDERGEPYNKDQINEAKMALEIASKHTNVSIKNLYEINTSPDKIQGLCGLLEFHANKYQLKRKDPPPNEEENSQARKLAAHFRDYLNQPPQQRGGVISSIQNYLYFFTDPQISEVFCSDEANTVNIEDMDKGKVITLSMPQYYNVERTYIATFMKFLYYQHALIRYDKGEEFIKRSNNLVLIADEAQNIVTDSEGITDYRVADKIRGANATLIFATQSLFSIQTVLNKEKAKTLILNLTNKIIMTEEEYDACEYLAKYIGQIKTMKRSYGKSGHHLTVNYQQSREYLIDPHTIHTLRKFQAIIVHTDNGWTIGEIKPIDNKGKTPSWYYKVKAEEAANYKPPKIIKSM